MTIPFDGAPVSSVAWVGPASGSQLLLAGDVSNAQLALLGTDSDGPHMPVLQSLRLQSSSSSSRSGDQAFFNHLAVLQAEGLVVLANTRGNAIYVVSLGRKGAQPCFAHFSKFPVTTPILSLAAGMVDEDGPSQGKAQLACTQTQVIPAGQHSLTLQYSADVWSIHWKESGCIAGHLAHASGFPKVPVEMTRYSGPGLRHLALDVKLQPDACAD